MIYAYENLSGDLSKQHLNLSMVGIVRPISVIGE